jgi:hypothetical protein
MAHLAEARADRTAVNYDEESSTFGEVSTILWRERQLLELLVFKLEEEQLMLAAGKTRWLPHSTREVEMVLDQIKRVELNRAMMVDALATQLDLEPGPTLRRLVEATNEPWRGIFEGHRQAFVSAMEEVRRLAETNKTMLARGHQATRETLAWLAQQRPEAATYSHAGAATHAKSSAQIFSKAL